MTTDIRIQRGFPDALRLRAAILYDDAFGAKISIGIPDADLRISVLRDALDPEYSFVAMAEGELVGLAGFKTRHGTFFSGVGVRQLLAQLGLVGAIRAKLIFFLFERHPQERQLLMDGLCVAPTMRSRGIGTLLLDALKDYAKNEGYQTLRLDVIDTNPGARRLYERLGFVATRTIRLHCLRWLLGFAAATTMECRVDMAPT